MPQMTIKPAYEMGQIVYLKSDSDQYERIVTGYHVFCNGIGYFLRYAEEEVSEHTPIEISETKKV